MIKLRDLVPTNLQQEKGKFFQNQDYNPQFTYQKKFDSIDLHYYGLPKQKYLDLAKEIVDKAYFNKTEKDILDLEGAEVNQEKVDQKIKNFLREHHIENRFGVIWSESFLSSVSFTPQALKLRTPCKMREGELRSLLFHEIGTHALRRVNYEQQPWFKKKRQYGFRPHLRTEEGLATLHSLIARNFKYAARWALSYLLVDFAQQHSFVETWNFLKPYIQNPDRRWLFTIRRKRGIIDTSQPGGFTKDLIYLEGTVEIYKYLEKNNFDITKLYYGKIAHEDAEKVYQLNPNFRPLLPIFYTSNQEKYVTHLNEVAEINLINQVK